MDRYRPPSRVRRVYAIRLSAVERQTIVAAAAARQLYISEYIRAAALEAARRDLAAATGAEDRDRT